VLAKLRARLTYANVVSTVCLFRDRLGTVHLKGLFADGYVLATNPSQYDWISLDGITFRADN
jgi:hypothetical protein